MRGKTSRDYNLIVNQNNQYEISKRYKREKIHIIASTKKEAIKKINSWFDEVDKKDADFSHDMVYSPTLKEYFQREYIYYRKSIERLQDVTINKEQRQAEIYLSKYWNKRLIDIDNRFLISIVKDYSEKVDDERISMWKYNGVISSLKRCLKYAKEDGLTAPNLNIYILSTETFERNNTANTKTITLEQFDILINLIRASNKKWIEAGKEAFEFILKVYYYVGLRANEATALLKSDFVVEQWRENKIYYVNVDKHLQDNTTNVLQGTKGSKRKKIFKRKVYLQQKTFEELISFLNKNNYQNERYIFDFNNKGTPLSRKAIAVALKKVLHYAHNLGQLLEIPDSFSLQGFRISNGYYLKGIGINDKDRAYLQGHSVEVQDKYYTKDESINIGLLFSSK